jgi:Dockerin type I domain
MKKNLVSESGFLDLRAALALAFCSVGMVLATFSFAPSGGHKEADGRPRYMPVPGGEPDDLDRLEAEWNDRLTYPTGVFNPLWLRLAAAQDALIPRAVPLGIFATNLNRPNAPLALNPNSFTALGPQPEHMTGCTGCYDYGTTEGRVNAIVVDPTTTTNGSIVAYLGSVGGGVWKTTNCCSSSTTWTAVTDSPLLATISIDSLALDPNDHNTIYAGTGDLNYGSFSMGSQGILKSTDAGSTWTLLGANVFGAALPEPAGEFPQYQAVGKVRVDPNNSNNVVAGTKTGLYFSYDGGNNWTGPCTTNNYTTMRQDITGLELVNTGGTTRIIAAVGVRGFSTPVQYNLNQNGANGIYAGTMPASGCPSDFVPMTTDLSGWVGQNAASGVAYVDATTGNQLGRIDIAVAPSDPNYIYAQVQAITPNPNLLSCGNTAGCQLGAYRTTDGGATWVQIPGSPGASLTDCDGLPGDYPQNWYDQGVAVDPNNPDRVFFDTFEIWFWALGNPAWNDTTCGYGTTGNNGVHVDQHALAFVPGSSDILLAGNDGGVHATTNASSANAAIDPTWFNMDTGLNTIEFYAGDISGNFAGSSAPQAVGGAQDNGPSSVTFAGSPNGPVQWQMGLGGDGFSGQIDPVGTGTSLRFFEGNNSGGLSRCVSNCTAAGASWSSIKGGWGSDTQSFILPINLFHGGIPGGDDCPPAGPSGGCGHLIAGTTRVWETVTGNGSSVSWYVTNNPTTQDLTKQSLGNRSHINQVKYSPKFQSVAIVGTNDGNVQIGFNLGTGVQAQANWVNVTGSNAVLPNRPVLGIALDPSVSTADVPVGYAAVGGFNANTPTTPGHVFQVVCTSNCASFTWNDKTGNLPDIPVDSIIVNPKWPQQVFAGTDWGVYYTNDITAASPSWQRFENGLPHAMVWDMQIDRGATTLSVWTRSRGAYVWPLPSAPLTLASVVSRKTHGAAGTYDIDLTNGNGIECRSGGANGDYTMIFTFGAPVTSCGVASVGTASNGPDPAQCSVALSGIPNAQTITVQLTGVIDSNGSTGNVSGSMPVLIGDTNADGFVNSADISQTKSQSGNSVSGSNFREDVNTDGFLNSADISLVKSRSGTALP